MRTVIANVIGGTKLVNKRDLVDAVADKAELCSMNAVVEAITEALAAGDKVAIPGFGAFETRDRPARSGRHPQTGEAIEIAAITAPPFRAGSALEHAVAKA